MDEQNHSLMMNSLKRKLSDSNVQRSELHKRKTLTTGSGTSSSSSPAFSLIEAFLKVEQSKGELRILTQHFQLQWWKRENLLLQFLELVARIISLEVENPLEVVLQDIEDLGLAILGLERPDEKVYTTIVTSALQVSKEHELHAGDKVGVVKVEPNPNKGITSKLIDFAVKIMVKFLRPTIEKSAFIEGAFAPIREETSPTSDLKVVGEIPTDLSGMMIRNGPNPQLDPVASYAWLDGDSMLHAIRFKEGKATYVSRYVETSRYKQEKFFEEAEFLKYGDLEGQFGLLMSCVQLLKAKLGVLDVSYGWLNADTGVIFHDGMLMALQDFDKPYVVKVLQNGDLETLGINDYCKRLTHSVIPHPKKDPITGELFIMGVSYTPPYATYNYVTKQGLINNPVPITMSGPSYMHDLGITKNFVIFMDLPYCYDPEHMVKNEDYIYMLDIKKKPRFGVLPKYATSEEKIKWFAYDDTFFIYHNGNSWEEDEDTVVLISCLMKPPDELDPLINNTNTVADTLSTRSLVVGVEVPKQTKLFFNPAHVHSGPSRRRLNHPHAHNRPGRRLFNPAHVYNGPSRRRPLNPANVYSEPSVQGVQMLLSPGTDETSDIDAASAEEVFTLPTLFKITFNMKTGETNKEELSKTRCDYPKINENYMGRKSQYVYTSEFNGDAKIISVTKTDLKWKTELKLSFGENRYGSEVAFVPRQSMTPSMEDDGYLTTFVHDEKTNLSYTYVIDAQKMDLLATIELTNRVPYGFHATFVTEEELQGQKLI